MRAIAFSILDSQRFFETFLPNARIKFIHPPYLDSCVLVQTDNLTKTFGDFTALNRCTLQIESGVVFGLLGPNGAGKTTLLRLILGFLFPTSGTAMVAGFDCHRQAVEAHRRLTYMPGDAQLFGSMKGRKVLKFFAELRAECDFKRALALAERLELDLTRRVAFMSTGMRQKLALCVCLSTRTELTILDEPTANLDPTVRGEIIRIIDELRSEGRTVIFSSHVLSEIEDVCDRVVVMRRGEMVRDLSMAELKSRHRMVGQSNQPLVVPDDLVDQVTVQQLDENVVLDISGDLAPVLGWLGSQPIGNVRIEPIGLRTIYDQCHSGTIEQVNQFGSQPANMGNPLSKSTAGQEAKC